MTGDLGKDWLIYVLLVGMVCFFGYVIYAGNRESNNDKK